MKKILVSLIFIMAVCACSSQTPTLPLTEPPNNVLQEYKIGIDDVLQVNVWRNPELSLSVPVRPDGKISLPLIGDVVVADESPEEVAKKIGIRLKKFIREPQVTVILTQLNSHEFVSRVRVTGAVNQQISISYRQGMTVLDAILEAGGTNEFADGNRAKLFRKNASASISSKLFPSTKESTVNKFKVKLKDILNTGDLSTNYLLEPGDVIVIPERFF